MPVMRRLATKVVVLRWPCGPFQVGALALSMILLSSVINRFSSALVSLTGAALAALAHLAMMIPASLPPLFLCASIAGIGYGLVFGAAITGASTAYNPDRAYALGNGGAIIIIVIMMMAIPLATAQWGALGAFPAIALLIVVAAPVMRRFQARPERMEAPSAGLLA